MLRRDFLKLIGLAPAIPIALQGADDNITEPVVLVENYQYEDEEYYVDIDIGNYTITLNAPITGQMLYAELKQRWKNDVNLVKYQFPLVGITPDLYEVDTYWSIHKLYNLRKTGLIDKAEKYMSVTLLGPGMLFDKNKQPLPNSSLIHTKEKFFTKLNKESEFIDGHVALQTCGVQKPDSFNYVTVCPT